MDLKILKSVLESKSVPAISRLTGLSFNVGTSIEVAKTAIINEACKNHDVHLCESDAESIMSIIEHKPAYTDDQKVLINLLYKHGYNAICLEPAIKEENSINENKQTNGLITESANKIVDTEEIHKEIEESDEIESNKSSLIEKLQMCPYFSSLMMLEEDFNNIGLSINDSNNSNVLLCVLDKNGNPKNNKIFEDFMILGSKNNDVILTERIIECVIKFINKVANTAKSKRNIDNSWNNGPAPYGDAIGIDNSGISSPKQ